MSEGLAAMFENPSIGGDQDQDVLGMCQDLVSDATTREATAHKSTIDEPAAILKTYDSNMLAIDANFAHWPKKVKYLALGAMIVYKKRFSTETGIHEHVELLHALCVRTQIIARARQPSTPEVWIVFLVCLVFLVFLGPFEVVFF